MMSKKDRALYCRGCTIGHLKFIREDLSRISNETNTRSLIRNWLTHPGFKAVVSLRIMNHLYARKRYRISLIFRMRSIAKFGLDVFPGCKIDLGLRLEHPVGIVIGCGVSIGKNVALMHGVTLGQGDLRKIDSSDSPKVGDGVLIGAQACVFGPILIPDESFIRESNCHRKRSLRSTSSENG
jgi:serine O-acetyltransferase